MIVPVNGHLLIEPLEHKEFIPSDKGTYEEIGVVIDNGIRGTTYTSVTMGIDTAYPKNGDKVYFDAWLAAKYPKNNDGDFYWLVKWSDVRAIEHAEPTIPTE